MQRGDHRQRQQFAEQADDDERQGRAGGEPDHRADAGEHNDLRQVDREDVAAGGAERLERGDDLAAAVDMAFDGVGDADAADQQRRQADQGQELGEAADGALELRRGVVAAADFPAGFRQRIARGVDQRGRGTVVIGIVGQPHPVDPAHQAAGLQQSGGAQARFADEKARAEADAAGELVRLGADHAADLVRRAADGNALAELEVEPRQQGRNRLPRRTRRRARRADRRSAFWDRASIRRAGDSCHPPP